MHSDEGTEPEQDWAEIAERVSALVISVGDILSELHRRVPNDELWQFKALQDTGDDIFSVTLAGLWAAEELKKQPPKVQDPWPEGGHDPEDRLRIWAADPAGHRRPQWTIVALGAIAWCNVLEGYISGVSNLAIDATAIARVRTAFPEAQITWDSAETARVEIAQRMLPSTKKKGQSVRYLEAVFGCQIDPVIRVALRDLIARTAGS